MGLWVGEKPQPLHTLSPRRSQCMFFDVVVTPHLEFQHDAIPGTRKVADTPRRMLPML
jgi:hypothetical protein